ncbi:unnamed protein product [Moneuplotes crassus]|uniref:Uncharacterized protein n=1 Tax=Euplotes crassus TaxID=5936 RepID=A0AAD1U4F5_EUPCR|nr:unnamed protein product [Moneuplotes crassus]
MAMNQYFGNDENLADDLLSEGTSTSEVKVNERMNENMEMSPFNKSKHKKSADCGLLPQMSMSLDTKILSNKQPKAAKSVNKNMLCSFQPERRQQSLKVHKDWTYQDSNVKECKKVSIKDEISDLLKKSAMLREKRKFKANKKLKVIDIPLEEFEIFSNEAKEEGLFTFGD